MIKIRVLFHAANGSEITLNRWVPTVPAVGDELQDRQWDCDHWVVKRRVFSSISNYLNDPTLDVIVIVVVPYVEKAG